MPRFIVSVDVLVPVRHPLTDHSRRTLERAIEIAERENGDLTILHVDLYQSSARVTRQELKSAVHEAFGPLPNARYVVRGGFLVEETILEEVAAETPGIVVIGHKQLSRWRQAVNRLLNDPDIASFLRDRIEAEVVVVPPP